MAGTDRDGGRSRRSREDLLSELEDLEDRLRDAEETLRAIRKGEVDALVVSGPGGANVFTLRGANYAYRVLVESIDQGAATLGPDGTVLYCNRCFGEMLQQPLEKVMGERIFRLLAPETGASFEALMREGLRGRAKGEMDLTAEDGRLLASVQVSCRRLGMEGLDTLCVLLVDLTERKRDEASLREAYEQLKSTERRLRQQTTELDRKNIAMKELIAQISLEKTRIKEDVAANIRDSVLPILQKFRMQEALEPHVKALERHMEILSSPHSGELARLGSMLTLKEMDICRMIKGGLTSKEMAEALSVSVQTVEKHRKSIRRKLGITNRAVGLGAFLDGL